MLLTADQQRLEAEHVLYQSHESEKQVLVADHNAQLQKLQAEFAKLQKSHRQTVEILREENDSIREVIDEKEATIGELMRLKRDGERARQQLEVKGAGYAADIARLKDENGRILTYSGESKEGRLEVSLLFVFADDNWGCCVNYR